MRVRDVMTPEVVTVPADASILQAGELMARYDISGLPVVDDEGHLVGIVTERDFLRPEKTTGDRPRPRWFGVLAGRSIPPAAPDRFRERRVAEVMTPNPITVGEDMPLDEVVQLIELRDIKRLPVMRGDQLVGVVSRGDLLRALVQSIHNGAGAMKESQATRARLTELERQSWLHRTRL
jgi:CBS domain-containing protein